MEQTTSIDMKEIPSVLTQVSAPALVSLIVSKELDNLRVTRKLAGEAFLNTSSDIAIIHPDGTESVDDLITCLVGDEKKPTGVKVLLIDTGYGTEDPVKSLPSLTVAQLGLLAWTHGVLVVFLTETVTAATEQDSHIIAEAIPEEDGKYLLTVSKNRTGATGIYPFSL